MYLSRIFYAAGLILRINRRQKAKKIIRIDAMRGGDTSAAVTFIQAASRGFVSRKRTRVLLPTQFDIPQGDAEDARAAAYISSAALVISAEEAAAVALGGRKTQC